MRRILHTIRRWLLALLASVPGIALAMAAKPFLLGDRALLLGVLLAFALPVACLALLPPKQRERHPPEGG